MQARRQVNTARCLIRNTGSLYENIKIISILTETVAQQYKHKYVTRPIAKVVFFYDTDPTF